MSKLAIGEVVLMNGDALLLTAVVNREVDCQMPKIQLLETDDDERRTRKLGNTKEFLDFPPKALGRSKTG
jgi:hypothetical protein